MARAVERNLGARVAAYRQTAGLTQEQLAERVGMARETISRLERGSAVPSLHSLAAVAGALGVALHDLFDFRPTKTRRDQALDAFLRDLKRWNAEEIGLVHEVGLTILRRVRVRAGSE